MSQSGPVASPGLPVDETHVWKIDLASPPTSDPSLDLQTHELDEARRRLSSEATRRFLMRRSAMRRILGVYLAVPAPVVALEAPPGEKPRLAAPSIDLRFNLTHTGDTALLAVALGHEVGIDLEPLDAGSRLTGAYSALLTPRERGLVENLSGEDLVTYLTWCWVRKEAYAKAVGSGLRIPLQAVETETTGQWGAVRASVPSDDPRTWSVTDLELVDGHAGALVIEGEPAPVRAFDSAESGREFYPAQPERSRSG